MSMPTHGYGAGPPPPGDQDRIPDTIIQVQVFTGVYACILIFLCVLTTILYIRRRETFPLKGRGWRMVVLLMASIIVNSFNVLFLVVLMGRSPPWVFGTIYSLTFVLAIMFYILRAWRLLFAFKLTDKMLELNQLADQGKFAEISTITQQDWYLRNRHWLSTKRTAITFGISYVVVCGLCAVVVTSIRQPGQMQLIITSMLAAPIASTFYVAWQLRSFKGDAHSVKLELTAVGITTVALVPLFAILYVVTKYFYLAPFMLMLAYSVVVVMAGILPIIASYRWEARQKAMKAVHDADSMLRWTLTDAAALEPFLSFTKSEFSTENVLFWREIEKANSMSSLPALKAHLTHIYQTYVSDTSTIQVNLSADLRRKLDSASQELQAQSGPSDNDATCGASTPAELMVPWLEAQKQAFVLMLRDSFPRYLQSPMYKEAESRKHVDLEATNKELTSIQHNSHRPLHKKTIGSNQDISQDPKGSISIVAE